MILILREDGLNKICEWLPYLKKQLSTQFLTKRYQPEGNRASLYCRKQHPQQALKEIYTSKIEEIIRYLLYLVKTYQESIIVVYRFSQIGFGLKYGLMNVTNLVKFINYDDVQYLQMIDGTVVMIEPFLREEEQQLKALMQKLIGLKVKIQFICFSFEEKYKDIQSNYIYPNFFQGLSQNENVGYQSDSDQSVEIIERQTFVKQRKTIVYFDSEDYNPNQCIEIDNLDTTYEQASQGNNKKEQKNLRLDNQIEKCINYEIIKDDTPSIKEQQGMEKLKFQSFVIFNKLDGIKQIK